MFVSIVSEEDADVTWRDRTATIVTRFALDALTKFTSVSKKKKKKKRTYYFFDNNDAPSSRTTQSDESARA